MQCRRRLGASECAAEAGAARSAGRWARASDWPPHAVAAATPITVVPVTSKHHPRPPVPGSARCRRDRPTAGLQGPKPNRSDPLPSSASATNWAPCPPPCWTNSTRRFAFTSAFERASAAEAALHRWKRPSRALSHPRYPCAATARFPDSGWVSLVLAAYGDRYIQELVDFECALLPSVAHAVLKSFPVGASLPPLTGAIARISGYPIGQVRHALARLADEGLLVETGDQRWTLTSNGRRLRAMVRTGEDLHRPGT